MLPKFCLAKNLPKVTVPVPSREILVCGGTWYFSDRSKAEHDYCMHISTIQQQKRLQIVGVVVRFKHLAKRCCDWCLPWKSSTTHCITENFGGKQGNNGPSSENRQVVWVNMCDRVDQLP